MIRKFRGRDSGMSAIPFVVSLLVVAGFAVAWYNADKEANELRAARDRAREEATERQADREKYFKQLLELTEVTGYPDAQGMPDKAKLQAELQGALDKWRERLTVEFTADKYQPIGTGGAIEKLQGDKIRVVYVPAKDQIQNPTVQAILPIIESAAVRMQVDVKRAFEGWAAEVRSKADQKTSFDQALAAQRAQYDQLKTETDQARRTAEEQISELRNQKSAVEQQVTAAQSELEQVRGELGRTQTTAAAAAAQAQAEIKTLVRRDQPFISEGPDGSVVAAGAGVVVIDLGKKQMLQPGTVFRVLGRIKGGDLVPKGSIKVVVSNELTAEARVVEQDPNNPINSGDLVQSETFSPSRQMRFAFVGEFRKMGRSAAEARLRSLGAAVDAAVTTQTHYLVVGTAPAGESIEETDAYKKAREYGVTILTEDQLASFTLY